MATDNDQTLEWIRLYRKGITGAGVAHICGVEDILEVLNVLAAARRLDPSLEAEHITSLRGRALDVEESLAKKRALAPSWSRRIEELTSFVTDHGRMPRQAGGDQIETALGRWLHAQRAKVGKGTLDSRQRAALDTVGAWDSDTRAKRDLSRFPAQLKALAEFRSRHRRWPTYRNRADSHECALGTWLITVRQAGSEGRLPHNLREALDRHAPGWNR